MRIALSLGAIGTAIVLRVLDVEPVPTWLYVFTWYPVLIIGDTFAAARVGGPSLFGQYRLTFSVFGWSMLIWLLYEAINLRITNWYYVFLPLSQSWRWFGILVSFATVIPAVVIAERVLRSLDVGTKLPLRPRRITPNQLRVASILGLITLALALAWPVWFGPLIWGVGVLVADPVVYRRRPADSLIADAESGRWDRITRLLIGGLAIGILWEGLNYWARGKWIYTVPLLETIKVFEMPPLGFVGFPIFALSAWSLYHLLCAWKVAVPLQGQTAIHPVRLSAGVAVAVIISLITLRGMERRTISSTVPNLQQLPGVDTRSLSTLRQADIDTPFELAGRDAASLGRIGLTHDTARTLLESARLVTLRGIGAYHVSVLRRSGISSVCELSAASADELWADIHARIDGRFRPTEAEVRVWIRAANDRKIKGPMACEGSGD